MYQPRLPTDQLDYTVKVVTEEEPTTLYTVHTYTCSQALLTRAHTHYARAHAFT